MLGFCIDGVLMVIHLTEARSKKILDLMNVPWLTRENVASHLQVMKNNSARKHYYKVK